MRIEVRVHPRASRSAVEDREGTLHIYTTAPPKDGDANEAVQHLLAKHLKRPKTSLRLVSGQKSRTKIFEFD